MKKILLNKVYDTSTAILIGVSEHPEDSPAAYTETLYRKKTGEYFLHGVGGAASKYAVHCGASGFTAGEAITPLSLADAQSWASNHLPPEVIAAEFTGGTDDTPQQLNITIPKSSIKKARYAASRRGMTLAGYIDSLIKSNPE